MHRSAPCLLVLLALSSFMASCEDAANGDRAAPGQGFVDAMSDARTSVSSDAAVDGPDAQISNPIDASSGQDDGGAAPSDLDASGGAEQMATDAHVESDTSGSLADAARPEEDAAAGAGDAGPGDAGSVAPRFCGRILCDCTLDGQRLWGKVEIVDAFGNFKVREVTAFADLKVEETSFPDRCGRWEIVDNFGDFTIELVDAFEDFSIEYSSFPGLGMP